MINFLLLSIDLQKLFKSIMITINTFNFTKVIYDIIKLYKILI